jgi:hypothetical protein
MVDVTRTFYLGAKPMENKEYFDFVRRLTNENGLDWHSNNLNK